jgi:hypothetical protein
LWIFAPRWEEQYLLEEVEDACEYFEMCVLNLETEIGGLWDAEANSQESGMELLLQYRLFRAHALLNRMNRARCDVKSLFDLGSSAEATLLDGNEPGSGLDSDSDIPEIGEDSLGGDITDSGYDISSDGILAGEQDLDSDDIFVAERL